MSFAGAQSTAQSSGPLPPQLIDPTLITETLIPIFRNEINGLLETAIRTASLIFARKVAAPVAVLIPAGLPKELHGRVQIDATVTSIVNRIAGGAGAVFRMALLPQRRAELLHEIHTPRLDKTSLKLLVQNELRKRAGLYIMAPLRNLLDKQGKYGKYIGAAVSKLINVNVIIDIVGKIIDRLPI